MLSSIAVCLVYAAACAATGVTLMRVIGVRLSKWRDFSAAAFLATVLLLGQGLLASVWLMLGLAGAFSLSLLVGSLVMSLLIGSVVVGREIGDISRRLWAQLVYNFSGLQGPVRFLAVLALSVIALLGVVNTILPVRFGSGDGIAFYMVLAKVMAASQSVAPVSGHEYNHGVSGFMGEMHHAALLVLDSEQAALLFVWVTALCMLTVLVVLCGYLGVGRVGKWVAVVMMLSSTTISFYLIDGKVDIFAAAMGVAALYWALRAERGRVLVPAVCLAGLFTGFAVVAKATYALVVALPVLALLLWRARQARFSVSLWILFALLASLTFVPNAAKNILFFSEPFAPFFFLDSQIGAVYRSQGSWNPPQIARQIFITYPLALAYGDYTFQYGNISGLYIALGPLVFLVPGTVWRRHGRLVRFTLVIAIAMVPAVFLQASYRTMLGPRFVLPALMALIPAISFAAEYVFHASAAHTWFRGVMVACLCIALIGYSTLEQDLKRVVRYKIGGRGICDLEGFPVPECHDMLALNELAGRGDRINTGNDYTYWLRADLIQCLGSRGEQGLLGGTEAYWERLYDHGFRFVENVGESWDLTEVPDGLQVSLVYSRESRNLSKALQIYELGSSDPNRSPSFVCRQTGSGVWGVVETG